MEALKQNFKRYDMVINSNMFIEFVKRHMALNENSSEWSIRIERMNRAGLLSSNTYQSLKQIIIT